MCEPVLLINSNPMKTHFLPSIRLTVLLVILFALLFPLLISGVARLAPGGGKGETLVYKGRVVGYANIGQQFSDDKYFWSRPSAAGYNAAGSAGSNKGASNAEYLQMVQSRIDTFMAHHPYARKQDIPAEMVTAIRQRIGSAYSRHRRHICKHSVLQTTAISPWEKCRHLINSHTEKPLLGLFGPAKVNVLKLNIALDELTTN